MAGLFESNYSNSKGKTSNIWFTPKNIIESLSPFDMDVCTSKKRPFDIGGVNYTPEDNGLKKDWKGLIWCNPPYGRHSGEWVSKCISHGNCIMLLFVRTDTKVWQQLIFKYASGFLFLDNRLSFINQDFKIKDRAGSPSVLIAFGDEAYDRLNKCSIKGKRLKNGE